MNNLSIRISSEQCQGCGKCCESFEIWYGKQNGELINSEVQRFQMLADIGDKITTRKIPGLGTWLIFNFPCRYLNPDKSCAIYGKAERPLLCRMFPFQNTDRLSCPKVKAR